MPNANEAQIEYWNGPVGQRWADAQEEFDHFLSAITARLMLFAAPKTGERVLDIGCGAGTTTFMLREAVGEGGAAAGIDISRPMLDLARARMQASNADVAFVEDDASLHDFQAVNDLVFSRFGVMFFADPVAAFSNIRRALAREGRLVFVCYRALDENPWAAVPLAAGLPFLPSMPPADPFAPGPFAFADRDRLHLILEDAGYSSVQIRALDTVMHAGNTAEDTADIMLRLGPLSRAAADADEAVRGKIKQAVSAAMEPFASSDGITPPAACWLVSARR